MQECKIEIMRREASFNKVRIGSLEVAPFVVACTNGEGSKNVRWRGQRCAGNKVSTGFSVYSLASYSKAKNPEARCKFTNSHTGLATV